MTTINLRKFYPFYTHDEYIEIPDEVAAAMTDADRLESNYRRKIYYHRAQYSLDCGDGIENSALFFALAPDEIYEHKWTIEQIYAALNAFRKSRAGEFTSITYSAYRKRELRDVRESLQAACPPASGVA